jgi:hypothetical protein
MKVGVFVLCPGQQASYYFILFQLFPFTYPLMRLLATSFPDKGLLQVGVCVGTLLLPLCSWVPPSLPV